MREFQNKKSKQFREKLKDKKRIVVKIGSSTITHEHTGELNLTKLEKLVRLLSDLSNQGKEVILVSSGAIATGKKTIGMKKRPETIAEKQACAAIGQAKLMMIYQKLFAEYNHVAAQILLTKVTILKDDRRINAQNTFQELLKMGAIPVVNENDTVSTEEIEFGDNDTLSAIVAALASADLLILLSDIDGMYTDDPRNNVDAELIELVTNIDENLTNMAKGTSTNVGTGGMSTKVDAAQIATRSGVDMVIANGERVEIIHKILDGKNVGTLFTQNKTHEFDVFQYIIQSTKDITK